VTLKPVPSKELETVHLQVDPRKRGEGVLLVVGGVDAGRVLRIKAGVVSTLGRLPDCTFSFDDPSLSRVHAQVMVIGQEYLLQDAGSRNGTFLNEARLTEAAKLKHGDRLQIGTLTLNFLLADESEVAELSRVFDAAVRDGLTRVYNRKYLQDRLATELAFALRGGADLSLIMFDVDHFKRVNDTYGHPGGDAVLREVALKLGEGLRAEDTLARYGGEEFVILCRELSLAEAAAIAERQRAAIEAHTVRLDEAVVRVTASAGVAALSECQPKDQQTLLGLVDQRLYQAKSGGRNRVVSG